MLVILSHSHVPLDNFVMQITRYRDVSGAIFLLQVSRVRLMLQISCTFWNFGMAMVHVLKFQNGQPVYGGILNNLEQ